MLAFFRCWMQRTPLHRRQYLDHSQTIPRPFPYSLSTIVSRVSMMYTTISPTLFLTSSRTRSGLVPGFSRFSLEKAGKTGTNAGEILDQSATRLGAGWENVSRSPLRYRKHLVGRLGVDIKLKKIVEWCAFYIDIEITICPDSGSRQKDFSRRYV